MATGRKYVHTRHATIFTQPSPANQRHVAVLSIMAVKQRTDARVLSGARHTSQTSICKLFLPQLQQQDSFLMETSMRKTATLTRDLTSMRS